MAAFLAVAVTFLGVMWSGYLTRQSNKNMEKDMNIRHRPWLLISNPKINQIKNEQQEIITYSEWQKLSYAEAQNFKPNKISWIFNLKNIGLTPATNIRRSSKNSNKKLTDKDFTDTTFDDNILHLVPDQETQMTFTINLELEGENLLPHYVLSLFEYDFKDHLGKSHTSRIGKIWKMEGTGWTALFSLLD